MLIFRRFYACIPHLLNVLFLAFQMSDVLKCHENCCPAQKKDNSIKLSLDGVSESRSTNISLDVYSIKLNECQTVYPLRIIRPLCKLSVNQVEHFEKVLTDIDHNQCKLTHVIACLLYTSPSPRD